MSSLKRPFRPSTSRFTGGSALTASEKSLIECMKSPGSYLDKAKDYRPEALPTGEPYRVVSERSISSINITPDSSGRIIILSTPFFDAPWIHVKLDADSKILSSEAIPFSLYRSNDDYLGTDKMHGYRITYSSLTGTNSTKALEIQGTVTQCVVPLTLDTKRVYDGPNNFPYRTVRTIDRPPLTSNEIPQVTSVFQTENASQGSYLVLNHSDSSIPFTLRDCDENKAVFNQYYINAGVIASTVVKNSLAISTDDTAFCFVAKPGTSPTNIPGDVNHVSCTAPGAMNLGVTIYEGQSTTCAITFKMIAGWELIPKSSSSKVNQAYAVPPLNHSFITALSLAQSLRCIGVADDNSWGSFTKGLGKIWDVISPFAKSVSTFLPPEYGMAVSSLTGVGDSIRKINLQPNKPKKNNNNGGKSSQKNNNEQYQNLIVARPGTIVDTRPQARRLPGL